MNFERIFFLRFILKIGYRPSEFCLKIPRNSANSFKSLKKKRIFTLKNILSSPALLPPSPCVFWHPCVRRILTLSEARTRYKIEIFTATSGVKFRKQWLNYSATKKIDFLKIRNHSFVMLTKISWAVTTPRSWLVRHTISPEQVKNN